MSPVEHEIVTALKAISQAVRCLSMGESVAIADAFLDLADKAIANVCELAGHAVVELAPAPPAAGGSSEPGGER